MPRGERRLTPRVYRSNGFTYLVLLVVVAALGLGLAKIGPLWEEAARRDREQELLRVGESYAQALADARRESPGGDGAYPARLEDLLLDTRFVGTRRHLRRLLPDPLQPGRPWGVVRDARGAIIGVYSQDQRQPLAVVGLERGPVSLRPATRYSDWVFGPRELLITVPRTNVTTP
jgi:type II secretory pathway pseudopilin PulG